MMGSAICSKLTSFRQKCHELVVKKLLRRGRAHPEDFAVAGPQEEPLAPDETDRHDSVDELSQVHSNSLDGSPLQSSPCLPNPMENSDETPLIPSTEGCAFCSLELTDDNSCANRRAKLQHTFFHEECPSCSSAGVPLCEFCEHLRLPHLLMCLPGNTPCFWFKIPLNPPIDILNQKDCELCQFLANSVRRLLHKPARTANSSPAQLKLRFNLIMSSRQSNHAHWSLHLEIHGNRGVVSDKTEIRQKFLRDVCAKCDAPDVEPLAESEGFVEWNIVRGWLRRCNAFHAACSMATKPSLPPKFRVIDVKSRRVVQVPDCEFVALSYVWGRRPTSPSYVEEATRENIKALSSRGLAELPRTIEDAISVCKNLNRKYLWVDRYCIVQDDEENKHIQISAMADIYAASEFTIIACCGAGAESGIPGVIERRQKPRQINFSGVELIHAPPTIRLVMESIWNSRGWTYQEASLARKRLFLTPMSIYYECISMSNGQGVYGTEFCPKLHIDRSSLFQDYSRHIHYYTSRKLSYDDDIFNAFEGIAHALYGDENPFHFGIPALEFDRGLLWTCNGFSCSYCETCGQGDRKNFKPDGTHQIYMENRHNDNSIDRPNDNFCSSDDRYFRVCKQTTPSWSWASLKSPVHFVGPEYFTTTLVKWIMYKHEKTEIRSTSINATNESGLWPYQAAEVYYRGMIAPHYPQLSFALAIRERCFEAEIECCISKEDSFKRLRERFAERWPKYINAYDEIPEISPKEGPQSDGVLFTRAQSAFFFVDSYWIKDCEGLTIGYVSLDPRLHQIQATAASRRLSMEFIALSISSYPVPRPQLRPSTLRLSDWFYWDIPKEQYREMTYFDCKDTPLLPVPVVNVMLICWKGDFAQRIAVGLIVLKQWAKAERKFKDVWLK